MATTTRPQRPSHRRARPNLAPVVTRMQYPLAPLHPLPNGAPHPSFPATILSYHLLTADQCDSIARYYHQLVSSPCIWTHGYPTTMDWDAGFLDHVEETKGANAVLDIKRRKVGRFIGLRGCDTPVEERDERERWYAKRERLRVKAMGDFGFAGRRGFGEW